MGAGQDPSLIGHAGSIGAERDIVSADFDDPLTAAHLVYDHGRAERVWQTAKKGDELFANLKALPGFGDQKAKIFIALLGKRMGVQPPGWQAAAGFYAEHGCYSVADVDGPDSLAKVREYKRAAKAEAKAQAAKR